jgi:protein O-mannosyl-transferase
VTLSHPEVTRQGDAPQLHRLLACLSLALVIGATWSDSLHASFQFDDWNVIVYDPRVHGFSAWWHSLPGIRAVLKLSYALNYEFGATVVGFRLFNVGIHLVNTLLVFGLLSRRGPLFAALLVAAVFALDPVQTEAVTYISGRSSSLVALPCLCALWLWELALEQRNPRWTHIAGVACYGLALGIKETAWVLPAAIALWHITRPTPATQPALGTQPIPATRPTPGTQSPRATQPASSLRPSERHALVGYSAMALIAVVVALSSPTYRHLLQTSLTTRSIQDNLSLQVQAWGFLCRELTRLVGLNADPPLGEVASSAALPVILWATAWSSLAIAAWRARQRSPQFTFGVLWFFLWLLPTNSLLPRLDVANDRQLYLALIGPVWILAVAITPMTFGRPGCRWAALALLTLALGAAAHSRNSVYGTEVAFWQDALERSPTNARAANNLGFAYALECREDAAEREFERAIALQPGDFRARVNLRFLRERAISAQNLLGARITPARPRDVRSLPGIRVLLPGIRDCAPALSGNAPAAE